MPSPLISPTKKDNARYVAPTAIWSAARARAATRSVRLTEGLPLSPIIGANASLVNDVGGPVASPHKRPPALLQLALAPAVAQGIAQPVGDVGCRDVAGPEGHYRDADVPPEGQHHHQEQGQGQPCRQAAPGQRTHGDCL